MKTLNWQEIRTALRQTQAPPPLPPADAFWSAFQTRRQLHPQAPAARTAQVVIPWFGHRWLWAAAAGMLICSLAVFSLLERTGVPPASPLTAASDPGAVVSVDVHVNYKSVMIVQDKMNRGTVVWLTGLQ